MHFSIKKSANAQPWFHNNQSNLDLRAGGANWIVSFGFTVKSEKVKRLLIPSKTNNNKKMPSKATNMLDEWGYDITCVHSVLRRCMEQIVLHAKTVQTQDIPAFLGFVSAFVYFLHSHHTNEDEFVFPAYQAQGFQMAECEEEHKQFDLIMDELRKISSSPASQYSGE